MTQGHAIVITPTDLHVEIHVDGVKVAETDRAVRLEETGLPARHYLPREDVRMDLLRATSFSTTCPFKGDASYWSLTVGDQVHDGIVWSYEQPIPGAEGITGLMCFYDERVELTVRHSAERISDPIINTATIILLGLVLLIVATNLSAILAVGPSGFAIRPSPR